MIYRLLFFKCAETGKRFGVLFGQYSPSHLFQVKRIFLNEKEIRDEIPDDQSDHLLLEISTGRYLDRTANKPSDNTRSSQSDNQEQRKSFTPRLDTTYKVDEFDFSGWYCPQCGYAKGNNNVWPQFIQCTKCGELVCGGRVTQVNESRLFACCDDCGSSGLLKGEITSYTGRGIDSPERKLLPENSKQLPQLPSPTDRPV
jgi:hypothetical protein